MELPSEAIKLHRDSITIIAHDHLLGDDDLLGMPAAGLTAKVALVSVDAEVWSDRDARDASMHRYTGFTEPARAEMARLTTLAARHPDQLLVVRTVRDIEEAKRSGRAGLIFGFEGGKPIEQDLRLLHDFHARGLRVLQLTWAGGNDLCDRRDPPVQEGLTAFGRTVIEEANALGILIDPGHCSRKTFDQVLELSDKPIGVLHAIPAGSKSGAGDLSDEQIRDLAAGGGVIGLHFFSHYLNPTQTATAEDLVDHMEYLSELVGIEHVALGGDYLELTPEFRETHGMPRSGFLGIPPDLDSYEKLPLVTQTMLARGFSEEQTKAVLGENLMSLFARVWN